MIEELMAKMALVGIAIAIAVAGTYDDSGPEYRYFKCVQCSRQDYVGYPQSLSYCHWCGGRLYEIQMCKVCGEQPAHIDGECVDCCH